MHTRRHPRRGAASSSTGARATAIGLLGAGLLTAAPRAVSAQAATRAETGAFQPPTPSDRFRQDSTLNNLEHPAGYVTAPSGSLGQVVMRGQGDVPVILVAGLGFGWRVFDGLMAAHENDYRFYAVSLAGYGGSSAPPMPQPGTSYAERTWLAGAQTGVAALIDEEGLDRPLVMALYSDAANVVTHLAAESPERVGGLLIMSAAARTPLPDTVSRAEVMDRFAERWFKTVTEVMWPSGMFTPDYYANEPDVAERAWWEVLEPSLPTSIRYTVETWADDLVPLARTLTVPAIVLSPGFDEAFMSGPHGEGMRTRFYGGWQAAVEAGAPIDHRIVPGARFLMWMDRPEAVAGALAELVAKRATP